jgi:hypothetical protein
MGRFLNTLSFRSNQKRPVHPGVFVFKESVLITATVNKYPSPVHARPLPETSSDNGQNTENPASFHHSPATNRDIENTRWCP